MKEVYDRLKREYLAIVNGNGMRACNPPKVSFSMASADGVVTAITNSMSAQTENGVFTKVISIDDISGKTNENIIYTDNDLNIYEFNNIGLTTLRCALMACLAVDLNMTITEKTKVGFIGNGKINRKTCEALRRLFGVNKFVIRGSAKDRAKHQLYFEAFGDVEVDYTESLQILNSCDVVICCTNAYKREDLIPRKKLNKPKLFISQDSGYVLDESFRHKTKCYSDYPEQLSAHYQEEFPYDRKTYKLRGEPPTFNQLRLDRKPSIKAKSIYLYGLAIADAIVFEETIIKNIQGDKK